MIAEPVFFQQCTLGFNIAGFGQSIHLYEVDPDPSSSKWFKSTPKLDPNQVLTQSTQVFNWDTTNIKRKQSEFRLFHTDKQQVIVEENGVDIYYRIPTQKLVSHSCVLWFMHALEKFNLTFSAESSAIFARNRIRFEHDIGLATEAGRPICIKRATSGYPV